MHPLRENRYAELREDELWLRLDDALALVLLKPNDAAMIALDVWNDSKDFPDVRRAASELLSHLVEPFAGI